MFYARFLAAALPVMAALATACSNTDGPSTSVPPSSFDARHALATVDPMGVVFDQGIFSSFNRAQSDLEKFFRSGTPAPFPTQGLTFVFDPSANTYVADPSIAGAPAPGVRFVLYAFDASGGHFAFPLTRVGYVDLTPQTPAAGASQATHIVMARDAPALTVADFVVAHGVTAGVNVFDVTGYATDGSTRVNASARGTDSGGAGAHHLDYFSTLSAPTLGVTADEHLAYDQPSVSQSGRSELKYETHTLTDESAGTGSEVKFDGALYARVVPVTGGGAVMYLKPDGTLLTQQEVSDLEAVLIRPAVVHFFWINLAWP